MTGLTWFLKTHLLQKPGFCAEKIEGSAAYVRERPVPRQIRARLHTLRAPTHVHAHNLDGQRAHREARA